GNEAAQAAIRAAQRLGLRIVLARSMIDSDIPPPAYRESIDESVERCRALAAEFRSEPMVTIIPAPHSVHGASAAMIQAGAALAEELDSVWHIHVAEGEYEGRQTRERYGLPPLAWIHSLGVLTQRTCIVHGVWLEPAEIEQLGRCGGNLIYCPSSNMFLGDGITPLP